MLIRPLDRELLRQQFQSAEPFPYVVIEEFLEPEAAAEIAASYPNFDDARALGDEFRAVNEYRKIQITDASRFPDPVKALNDALASPELLADLAYITGIEGLKADASLAGGGIHVTGPRGRLDVHVDFNYLEEQNVYRRLNLLLYLNPEWDEAWGGAVELWDEDVKHCMRRAAPKLNRCVIFETSERSFHGVEEVRCPADRTRQSFAVYYYTDAASKDYTGVDHTTIFKARPDEHLKRYVLMPAERAMGVVREGRDKVRRAGEKIRRVIGR